jgi:hypothetical protein
LIALAFLAVTANARLAQSTTKTAFLMLRSPKKQVYWWASGRLCPRIADMRWE